MNKKLVKRVALLSKLAGVTYTLDFYSLHGYRLENETGSRMVTNRLSLKEMNVWLDGAFHILDAQAMAAQAKERSHV